MPASPPQKIDGAFLELPGEIRNKIYTMAIYPELSSIVIANCTKPEHLAASVLHLPLFRVCRQIRAECLSYICATFPLRILGLQTALLFFSCAGTAISEIKALVLVQPATSIVESKGGRDRVEHFLAALNMMDELNEMRLEGMGSMSRLGHGGEHMDFVRKVEDLSKKGVDVQVRFGKR
ncbi:uncharacterized protein ALTATR162_LOCUS10900 [Alternaria atra]|uniref:2EXR domain-containing protein n=1 Tax=Alternaria atra TaxID=119953 RepID=A0A8J2N559_9PLEO|nr:uncharacterized protein ALTATR162_LOCUS7851 [Alternaria atra]XP_043174475.1 uncharacterized protein ALTATR162_LOCUS10900 [Alternaria atra]CAG5174739.1 unnamed protein product [Alternaria atra]CAG5184081.1 unnamed protein product [Alternaria atra]